MRSKSKILQNWKFLSVIKILICYIKYFIFDSFLQNFSEITLTQIFSKVSSKLSESFHKISLKYLKNIQEIISKIKNFLKFSANLLALIIYQKKKILKILSFIQIFFLKFLKITLKLHCWKKIFIRPQKM